MRQARPRSLSTEEVIKGISDLPTPSSVLHRVLMAVSDPQGSLERMGKVVAEDPALTAKTLRLANSPYYGSMNEVRTVEHAVVLLGVRAVKTLALSVTVYNAFRSGPGIDFDSVTGLWSHFLAVATCSREIAAKSDACDGEVAFTAGLLHDMGILAFLKAFPTRYQATLAEATAGDGSLLELESKYFGVGHQFAGEYLAGVWKLPEELRRAIGNHHSGHRAIGNGLDGAVYMADRICLQSGFGYTAEFRNGEPLTAAEVRAVGLSLKQLDDVESHLLKSKDYIEGFLQAIV